jgi:hypothetical protein
LLKTPFASAVGLVLWAVAVLRSVSVSMLLFVLVSDSPLPSSSLAGPAFDRLREAQSRGRGSGSGERRGAWRGVIEGKGKWEWREKKKRGVGWFGNHGEQSR